MATAAQIAANQANSQHSTGPQTPEGKARVSQNATTTGIFAKFNMVFPGEEACFADMESQLLGEIAPEGALEYNQFRVVLNASWRLFRCDILDGDLVTLPRNTNAVEPVQKIIDRGRATAQRQYRQAMAELRLLQTERAFRRIAAREGLPVSTGVVDSRALNAMLNAARRKHSAKPAPTPPPAAKPLHVVASAAAATPAPVNRL